MRLSLTTILFALAAVGSVFSAPVPSTGLVQRSNKYSKLTSVDVDITHKPLPSLPLDDDGDDAWLPPPDLVDHKLHRRPRVRDPVPKPKFNTEAEPVKVEAKKPVNVVDHTLHRRPRVRDPVPKPKFNTQAELVKVEAKKPVTVEAKKPVTVVDVPMHGRVKSFKATFHRPPEAHVHHPSKEVVQEAEEQKGED